MTYVITQHCCNDASCVPECPVDCIRPSPEQREFATAEQLYIDPDTCIDCGACVDACPVGAIFGEDELPWSLVRFRDINAAYFQHHPLEPSFSPQTRPARTPKELGTLRVAIVGAGPAACYAAEQLLRRADVEVEMFDRLPTPWGLVRSGVAPDHQNTKSVANMFSSALRHDTLQFHLNVTVGEHISHEELLAHHHAVIYAVGASADRRLNIPGEDLPGSYSATDFVSWYNGHPDYSKHTFNITGERAVIVGNGNVALDVARVLSLPPSTLVTTDIAGHALKALRNSNIREVVVLGRRGPLQAAYTTAEFLALGHLEGVDVIIDPAELELDPESAALLDDPEMGPTLRLKYELAQEYAVKRPDPGNKRIVFRYLASPTRICGDSEVRAVEFAHNELVSEGDGGLIARSTGQVETLPASIVVRSVGYRGEPIGPLPFAPGEGIVPNDRGRVVDNGVHVPGVYVSGWIKRGPRGVIGSNRGDATETVTGVIEDFTAGRLTSPRGDRNALVALLEQRQPDLISREGWKAVDIAEKAAGKAAGRPRIKIADLDELVRTARD